MSAKAIQEATGKRLLNAALEGTAAQCRFVPITEDTNWDGLTAEYPWLLTEVNGVLRITISIGESCKKNTFQIFTFTQSMKTKIVSIKIN